LGDAEGRYIEFVKATFPRGVRLNGLKIVVDCANGAAYKVAPSVLWELGAEVVPIGVKPDGFNINRECGSTAIDAMRAEVVGTGADLGVALDGDADRVVLCDERGNVIDGDQVMALIAETWAATGRLRGGGLVATVMSNLGLEKYLEGLGLALVRTQVGDRYVVETMRQSHFNVGGEQSGHIILSDHCTTGDGLVAALQVLAAVVQAGRPASEVARRFAPLPQLLRNVRVDRANGAIMDDAEVRKAIDAGEIRLGRGGRLLIAQVGNRAPDPRHGGRRRRGPDQHRGRRYRRRHPAGGELGGRACRGGY